jgi:hypothetical protein
MHKTTVCTPVRGHVSHTSPVRANNKKPHYCTTTNTSTSPAGCSTPYAKHTPYSSSKKKKRRFNKHATAPLHVQKILLPQQEEFRTTPYEPICHKYQGRSNSSSRVAMANHFVHNEIYSMRAGNAPPHAATHHAAKMKRLNQFQHLVLPDVPTYNASQNHFYLTNTTDQYFNTVAATLHLHHDVQFHNVNSLSLVDTDHGCCHNLYNRSFTFVKVPRQWSLQKTTNIANDVSTLSRLLLRKKLVRGSSHLDVSTNYATFGLFCSRNSNSIQCKEDLKTSQISDEDRLQLHYMYSRANELALRVIPTEALRGIRTARMEIKWKTMADTNKIGQETSHAPNTSNINLWAAAAASRNYVSASHVDKDFFYSCLTVMCHDDSTITQTNGKYCHYRDNLPIAIYFCLPKKGTVIAMRPGDYIIFNPNEPHCVSMREKFYEDKHIYVMSFYLKSAIVGLNDNSMSNDELNKCNSLKYYFHPCP